MDLLSLLQNKASELDVAVKEERSERKELQQLLQRRQSQDEAPLNNDGDGPDESLAHSGGSEEERRLQLQQKIREKAEKGETERVQRERRQTKRREATLELLQTEISYVRSMMIIQSGFIKPLEKESILNPSEISAIFSNIRILLTFHKEFLKKLKERVKDQWEQSQCVGDIMLEMIPFLKMYTQYGMNYEHARETLQAATAANARLANFFKEGMETKAFDGLTLNAYLIMPVQRIPRYQMLLQVIVQNTEQTHEDHADLTKALQEVERVARTINQAIEKEVSINTLLKIQTLVDIQVVIPTRRFIREGLMRTTCFEKLSKKAKKKLDAQHAAISPEVKKRSKKSPLPEKRNSKQHDEPPKYATLRRGSVYTTPDLSNSEGNLPHLLDKKAVFRSTSVSDLSTLKARNVVPNPSALPEARIFLCNDIIIIAHPKDKAKTVAPSLITSWARPSELFPRAFQIATVENGTFLCFAADPAERDAWLQAIDAAIEALVNSKAELKASREKYALVLQDDVWVVAEKSSVPVELSASLSHSLSASLGSSHSDRLPPKGAALLARMGASSRALPTMRNRSQSQTVCIQPSSASANKSSSHA